MGTKRVFFFSVSNSTYSRIDLFLTDKHFLQNVLRSNIGAIIWSDNAPIILEFNDNLHKAQPPI